MKEGKRVRKRDKDSKGTERAKEGREGVQTNQRVREKRKEYLKIMKLNPKEKQ